MITCHVCKKKVENDNVQGLKYKTKSYCIDCFYENVKPNEVDKHFMYLKFQSITGRVPSSAEWTQCERLIKDHKWDWQKIELMLEYVYLIEQVEISDDYGVIGILPFYENQARKFYKQLDDIYDSLEDDFEDEVITIYVRQLEKPKKEVELTSIDNLIDWDDEEEWQE